MELDKSVIKKFDVPRLTFERAKYIGPEEQVSFWRDAESGQRYILFRTDHLSEDEDVGEILDFMAKIKAKDAVPVKTEYRPDFPEEQWLRSDDYRTYGLDNQVYELWTLPN